MVLFFSYTDSPLLTRPNLFKFETMANLPGSQRLRRNGSPSPFTKNSGPLRATIPVSLMTASQPPLDSKASCSASNSKKIPPISPLPYGKQKQSPWSLRQGSPTPKGADSIINDLSSILKFLFFFYSGGNQ